jgi:hypothetical protein
MPESDGKTPEQNLTRFLLGFSTVQKRRKTVSSLLSCKKRGSHGEV